MRAALLLLALGAGGCFSPDETDGTLRCGPEERCPEGFSCMDHHCWREEADPPTPDAPPAGDDGIDHDGDGATDFRLSGRDLPSDPQRDEADDDIGDLIP